MKYIIQVLSITSLLTMNLSCQISYLIKSSYYQIKLLNDRVDIEMALKDPSIDPETKRKIRLVQSVKEFAEERLHLVTTKNYSSFVKLNNRYVVYAITASPKDKLESYLWSFPIVGKVPYKGFFEEHDANIEKQRLMDQGLDVAKRGVSAYSTLGWFSDPLLSSMTNYEDDDLVETIIHELTHSTLYIKSNAEFNERFANFVGNKGVEEFYRHLEGDASPTLVRVKNKTSDSNTFSDFISSEIRSLEEFYTKNRNKPELLALREEKFMELKQHFEVYCKPKLSSRNYEYFQNEKLNNAILMSYKTYYQDLNLFKKLFENLKTWESFIDYFRSISNSKDPEGDLRKRVEEKISLAQPSFERGLRS